MVAQSLWFVHMDPYFKTFLTNGWLILASEWPQSIVLCMLLHHPTAAKLVAQTSFINLQDEEVIDQIELPLSYSNKYGSIALLPEVSHQT